MFHSIRRIYHYDIVWASSILLSSVKLCRTACMQVSDNIMEIIAYYKSVILVNMLAFWMYSNFALAWRSAAWACTYLLVFTSRHRATRCTSEPNVDHMHGAAAAAAASSSIWRDIALWTFQVCILHGSRDRTRRHQLDGITWRRLSLCKQCRLPLISF